VLLVVIGSLLAVALALAASGSVHRSASPGGSVVPAVGVHPDFLRAGTVPASRPPKGTVLFSCQSNSASNPPASVLCYGPDQIRAAYGVRQLLNRGLDGSGKTIVIIDAFGSPTIKQDLQTFDSAWGLPDPKLNVIAPDGVGGSDFGWAIETSLDVEWAHVIAPAAAITLVVAKTNEDADILHATRYAIEHNLGDVISQSFGENESCVAPDILQKQHDLFDRAVSKGITLFASSGDFGAAQPTCDESKFVKAASNPAADPDVTAVGGTELRADAVRGTYKSETTWNETKDFESLGFGPVASGGGFSVIYKRPEYQDGVVGQNRRGVPDVAYNAAINGGVLVFITDPSDPTIVDVFIVGGTSAGSPQWAGLTVLADELAKTRLGNINDVLYKLGTGGSYSRLFHDITTGNNSVPRLKGFPGTPVDGFEANNGWDPATGLGSPQADNLVPALAARGQ
jgi:subtilase family serine protease